MNDEKKPTNRDTVISLIAAFIVNGTSLAAAILAGVLYLRGEQVGAAVMAALAFLTYSRHTIEIR
jgi:hypothetical protein